MATKRNGYSSTANLSLSISLTHILASCSFPGFPNSLSVPVLAPVLLRLSRSFPPCPASAFLLLPSLPRRFDHSSSLRCLSFFPPSRSFFLLPTQPWHCTLVVICSLCQAVLPPFHYWILFLPRQQRNK